MDRGTGARALRHHLRLETNCHAKAPFARDRSTAKTLSSTEVIASYHDLSLDRPSLLAELDLTAIHRAEVKVKTLWAMLL